MTELLHELSNVQSFTHAGAETIEFRLRRRDRRRTMHDNSPKHSGASEHDSHPGARAVDCEIGVDH